MDFRTFRAGQARIESTLEGEVSGRKAPLPRVRRPRLGQWLPWDILRAVTRGALSVDLDVVRRVECCAEGPAKTSPSPRRKGAFCCPPTASSKPLRSPRVQLISCTVGFRSRGRHTIRHSWTQERAPYGAPTGPGNRCAIKTSSATPEEGLEPPTR